MGKKSAYSTNTLFTWVRRQSMNVKIFLAVVAIVSSLAALKYSVTNYNNFFVASKSVHTVGIMVLIYKLNALKTCSGLSLETQELTAIALAVRISCSFVMGHDINTYLEAATLFFTTWVIYMMRFKLYVTYNAHLDKTPKYYLIVPCAIMAVLIYPHSYTPTWTKIKWAFCVYLESVAVIPQLRMMQRTQMVEPFTAHYVFALGIARFLGAAHWILRVYESTGTYLFLLGRGYFWVPMVLVTQAVQTFILADFCYYYVKSIVSGSVLVKLPRV